MITYLDSSVLARAYLPDEVGHEYAVKLLDHKDGAVISGSWARIEVSGALVRAARASDGNEELLLAALEADLDTRTGSVIIVDANQSEVERIALHLVSTYGVQANSAWHLACASLAFGDLAELGEQCIFATHDGEQARLARTLGWSAG